MIPLDNEDLVGVYFHKPTKRVIGLTETTSEHLLKVQLEPHNSKIGWGNIALWDDIEKGIFNEQVMRGEIEWLKAPPGLSPSHICLSERGIG